MTERFVTKRFVPKRLVNFAMLAFAAAVGPLMFVGAGMTEELAPYAGRRVALAAARGTVYYTANGAEFVVVATMDIGGRPCASSPRCVPGKQPKYPRPASRASRRRRLSSRATATGFSSSNMAARAATARHRPPIRWTLTNDGRLTDGKRAMRAGSLAVFLTRAAVAAGLLASLGGGPAAGGETAGGEAPPSLAAAIYGGYLRFNGVCGYCHGPNGAGSTFAPSLVDRPIDPGDFAPSFLREAGQAPRSCGALPEIPMSFPISMRFTLILTRAGRAASGAVARRSRRVL